MNGLPGSGTMVEIRFYTNPFRGEKFEAIWLPIAEAALDYGAHGWGFFRSQTDRSVYSQHAYFDTKLEFERYWLSEQVSEARVLAATLYQVPLNEIWHNRLGSGTRAVEPATPDA